MNDRMKHVTYHEPKSFRRTTPPAYLMTAALLVVLFTAACGKTVTVHGVANIVATTTTGAASVSPSSAGSLGGFVAYSQCMRAHGISDFPDPNSQGQLQLKTRPGSDLDPSSPAFKAANGACKSLNPAENLSPAQQAQVKATTLKYSECMRQNGIADFPDPQPNGALKFSAQQGGDLDPNSPVFQKAQQVCKSLLPSRSSGSAGSTATTSGGN